MVKGLRVVIFGIIAFSSISLYAIDIELGPFNFSLGGDISVGAPYFEDPICAAMRDRDLVELVVEVDGQSEGDNISRLVVEPYALGWNAKKELVLRGYHIKGFDIPEKVDNDEGSKGKGMVGGIYTIFKGKGNWSDVKINKVRHVRVLENTDFRIRDPKELGENGKDQEIIEVICEIR